MAARPPAKIRRALPNDRGSLAPLDGHAPCGQRPGREPDPVPAPSRCAVSVAALRAGAISPTAPGCPARASCHRGRVRGARRRGVLHRRAGLHGPWRPLRNGHSGRRRSTRAGKGFQAAQRSPSVSTPVARYRSMRRTAYAVRPLLQTHGTPAAIPGVRRDSRHVVTVWRSGHRTGIARGRSGLLIQLTTGK